jgi:hypothetical protein
MTRAIPKPTVVDGLRLPDELAGYRYGVALERRDWLPGEHAAWLRRTAAVGADAVQRAWDALVMQFGEPSERGPR